MQRNVFQEKSLNSFNNQIQKIQLTGKGLLPPQRTSVTSSTQNQIVSHGNIKQMANAQQYQAQQQGWVKQNYHFHQKSNSSIANFQSLGQDRYNENEFNGKKTHNQSMTSRVLVKSEKENGDDKFLSTNISQDFFTSQQQSRKFSVNQSQVQVSHNQSLCESFRNPRQNKGQINYNTTNGPNQIISTEVDKQNLKKSGSCTSQQTTMQINGLFRIPENQIKRETRPLPNQQNISRNGMKMRHQNSMVILPVPSNTLQQQALFPKPEQKQQSMISQIQVQQLETNNRSRHKNNQSSLEFDHFEKQSTHRGMPTHNYSTVDLNHTQGTLPQDKQMMARSGSFSGQLSLNNFNGNLIHGKNKMARVNSSSIQENRQLPDNFFSQTQVLINYQKNKINSDFDSTQKINAICHRLTKPIGPHKNFRQEQASKNQSEIEAPEISCQFDEDSDIVLKPEKVRISKVHSDSDNHSTLSSESVKISQQNNVNIQFQERISKWRQQQLPKMATCDQIDHLDVQNLSEFSQEIYLNMRSEEQEFKVDPDYLQKVQTDIRDTSRAFLLEWMIDVHRKFRLIPEVLFVALHILDQYLSRQKIQKNQLHILGVTTLVLAAKYEEIYPPSIKDFLEISENSFNAAMVISMEKEILQAIQFRVTAPSAYRFLQRFRRLSIENNKDDELFFFAQYLLEVSLLDASLLKFLPSQLAASCYILASQQLRKKNCWTNEVENFSGYKMRDLSEVIGEVKSFLVEINPKFTKTLQYKFQKQEYLNVARHHQALQGESN